MTSKSWKKVLESDLQNVVNEIKESILPLSVVFIEGNLGAGKTTFSRYFIDQKNVQSPSYSIVNEYDVILHADLYRLEKKEDLIMLELPMYLEGKEYILIEWGLPYQNSLERIIGDDFNYFILKIEVNDQINFSTSSRNYFLSKIS